MITNGEIVWKIVKRINYNEKPSQVKVKSTSNLPLKSSNLLITIKVFTW